MASVELRSLAGHGYVVVVLRGELDTVDAESTGSAVAKLAERGQHLVIDLDTLEHIDCHALPGLRPAHGSSAIGVRCGCEDG
jgi:anti-anti-sigma factor